MASKKKGCEWCEEQRYYVAPLDLYHHFVKDEHGRFVVEDVKVPNNYCPNCGRKLT